ncbi:DNA primase [Candidatus Uhrbacteria bacterium]|nr:DNA primase [Candidatus Uhrbacteria bacterium]
MREQGIPVKPAGTSLKACCPFHAEKSPSFMVNRAKQVWYCFGCGKGGDLFTFVQEREGLEFAEALKLLADRAGVRLEAADPRLEGKKTRLLAVLEEATRFFVRQLATGASGAVARSYVAQRNIPDAMREQFSLGYAPDTWDALTSFLAQRGFMAQEIVDAGLGLPSHREGQDVSGIHIGSGTRLYDRFRHRLMFPIHDLHGRIVGFTGRILDGGTTVGKGDPPAKYVNTPETALYKKGAVCYGLAFAKDAMRTTGMAILVEGNVDVITSHGAGLVHTVAVSGTALTSEQLRLLKRFASILLLAFDADPAGAGAAERGIDAALDAGFDVRIIRMPTDAAGQPIAKDPDECIQHDRAVWERAVAEPVPVLDYYLARIRERFNLRVPAEQGAAGQLMIGHLVHVADPIERAAWVRRSADMLGVGEAAIQEALRRHLRTAMVPPSIPAAAPPAPVAQTDPLERLGNRLLALMVRAPQVIPRVHAVLEADAFPNPAQRELYNQLGIEYTRQENSAASAEASKLPSDAYVERLQLFADREFSDLDATETIREGERCARTLQRERITRELRTIADELRVLEDATAPAHAARFADLERRFQVLTHTLATFQ